MRNPAATAGTAVLTILFLSSCGGGGSSGSNPPPPPPPPATADVVAMGPLEDAAGFNVNGTRYATGGAEVDINGATGLVADLKTGQIVRVRGEITGSTATALDIEYDANVLGPVDSVDLAGAIIVVMGQRVHVSADTILDAALDNTSVGLRAEVSGYVDALGEIVATRVDLVAAVGPPRVIGFASAVDNANFVFRVNGLTLDYSAASVIDVAGGEVVDGMQVIATGTLDGAGVLNVTELDAFELDTAEFAGFEGSLTGVVTRFVSAADFDVAGLLIRADGQTGYLGGTAGDLREGITVRVDGLISSAGPLLAEQVRFGTVTQDAGTVVFDIEGFTGVEVGGPFITTIDQGSTFLVELTVDEHVVDLLDVRRDGTKLLVGFQDNVNINASMLRARIVMPELHSITLAGATYGTVSGFTGTSLEVFLAGAVYLDVNDSHYDTLEAGLAGACAFSMEGSTLALQADLDLVGASAATVRLMPGAALRGSSFAASALLYYGDNIDVDVDHDLTSAVVRLGGSL